MDGLPVPIRLLDPPLHEFLPEGNTEDIVKELIKNTGMTENEELGHQVSLIRKVAVKMFSTTGTTINYKICSMIEIPRAALIADELAEQAEFFSFKTNDLTRMTFGYSRDDVGKFLPIYPAKGLLQNDPFEIAEQAEFFSFGTNDLTQMTFGYSRDDVGKFLPTYVAKGLLQNDPS